MPTKRKKTESEFVINSYGMKTMREDVEFLLDDATKKLKWFVIDNNMGDEELLVFEALLARIVSTDIDFAYFRYKNLPSGRKRSPPPKLGIDMNSEIMRILTGFGDDAVDYFQKVQMNDDKLVIFKQMVSETLDRAIVTGLTPEELRCFIE